MSEHNHHWDYCDHCQTSMVICGKCGNNCCNGGYGEVDGIQCDACPSAYDMQDAGDQSDVTPAPTGT
jgi:hypothetical protein